MRTLRAQGRAATGVDIKPSSFTDHVGSVGDRGFLRSIIDGAEAVVHAATLHKPHVATHSHQDFIDTNVTATLVLLEEAVRAGVACFVFTSTTSAFGSALTPAVDEPATWVTEDVLPIAKNIYGVTKLAAENLCEMFARRRLLPTIVLRTSRFFPEADDDPDIRSAYEVANVQANEFLYRRVDIEDVVVAHLLAIERARSIGFGRYIVSSTTPFDRDDLTALRGDAPSVVRRLFPDYAELYAERRWVLFPSIDRVYVNHEGIRRLGWRPKYDFRHILDCLRAGMDFGSPLSRDVGSKGYHSVVFEDGPYPVAR